MPITHARTISPGAELDFVLDWGDTGDSWLQQGESIASYEVTVSGGLVLASHSRAGGAITACVQAPEELAVGQRVLIRWEVTTTATPPRVDSRFWELTVAKRVPGS